LNFYATFFWILFFQSCSSLSGLLPKNWTSFCGATHQVNAPDGHPCVFIVPQRLERIAERIRIGKWNERSEEIHNMTRKFKLIRIKAKVDKCTIHDLRKSAITNWSKRLPIQVTHKLAGHSNIKTTLENYLAVRPEDFKAAGEVLDEILQRAEN
jgi:hypothetical protein